MEGFEPPDAGTRNQCLTTWRHPNSTTNCTLVGGNSQVVVKITLFSHIFTSYTTNVSNNLYVHRRFAMQLSTKTLTSLLLVTAVAAAMPGISTLSGTKKRRESQYDRLLQRHDRKGCLRADVLGLSPETFRTLQKKKTFKEIIQHQGFKSVRSFRLALLGKLKSELHSRGWTKQKIDHYVVGRSSRIG